MKGARFSRSRFFSPAGTTYVTVGVMVVVAVTELYDVALFLISAMRKVCHTDYVNKIWHIHFWCCCRRSSHCRSSRFQRYDLGGLARRTYLFVQRGTFMEVAVLTGIDRNELQNEVA